MQQQFHNRRQNQYDNALRHSARFLNYELLRTSLTKNIQRSQEWILKFPKKSGIHRRSSYDYAHPYNSSQQKQERVTVSNRLKETFAMLQLKIKQAQQLFISPITKSEQLAECQLASGTEFNSTQRNSHRVNGNDITDLPTNKMISPRFSPPPSLITKDLKNIGKGRQIHENEAPLSPIKRLAGCLQTSRKKRIKIMYYISSIKENDDPRVEEHLLFSYRVLKKFENAQPFLQHRLNLEMSPKYEGCKTLLLDIDETILHCIEKGSETHRCDFEVKIKINKPNQLELSAYINLRPYALTFLKNMSKIFEIIAFTASHSSYANAVLNEIDSDNKIFSHRLYRQSCCEIADKIYTKDLRIVNRRMQDMVLVDNSPYSYIYQPQNAIPILPYNEGFDNELPKLQKYLLLVSECADVRELNKSTFKLQRYCDFNDGKSMIDKLYRSEYQKS